MIASTQLRRPLMYRASPRVPRMESRTTDRVTNVGFTHRSLVVRLEDGCVLSVPLTWYPRLAYATQAIRNNWEIGDDGGVRWPDIDVRFSLADLKRPIERTRVTE